VLILREPRDGQERKQDSEDDPDINAHQSSPAARSYPTQGADRVSAPTAGDSNRRSGLAITQFAGRVMADTILAKKACLDC